MKSDWDLECAYLGNAKPFLDIKVQKTNANNLTDWDIVTTSDLNRVATYAGKQTSQLANNFLNKVSVNLKKLKINSCKKSINDKMRERKALYYKFSRTELV